MYTEKTPTLMLSVEDFWSIEEERMLFQILNVKIPTYMMLVCGQPLWHRTEKRTDKVFNVNPHFLPQSSQHSTNVCRSYYKRHFFDVTLRRILFSKQFAETTLHHVFIL